MKDSGSNSRRGKVTPMLLPQAALIQRFIDNFTEKHESWRTTKKNSFGHVQSVSPCNWEGVKCDSANNVVEMTWGFKRLTGYFSCEYLPRSLVRGIFVDNQLSGSVTLEALPPHLVELELRHNRFTGGICLTCLPATIRLIHLQHNRFEGGVDLAHLSLSLQELRLSYNKFSGGVDLSHLPPNMRLLDISANRFSGPLQLQHLPPLLECICASFNCFSGLVIFDSLPSGMQYMYVNDNPDIYGVVDESILSETLFPTPQARALVYIHKTKIVCHVRGQKK